MDELKQLPGNLRTLRLRAGYTKSDVARALGIKPSSYHAYETGKTVPTLENFIRLARLYEVDLDKLIE